jgi:hypothetical protein
MSKGKKGQNGDCERDLVDMSSPMVKEVPTLLLLAVSFWS